MKKLYCRIKNEKLYWLNLGNMINDHVSKVPTKALRSLHSGKGIMKNYIGWKLYFAPNWNWIWSCIWLCLLVLEFWAEGPGSSAKFSGARKLELLGSSLRSWIELFNKRKKVPFLLNLCFKLLIDVFKLLFDVWLNLYYY